MRAHVHAFYQQLRTRRSVRDFSDRAVDRDIIDTAIRAAGTAPWCQSPALALCGCIKP